VDPFSHLIVGRALAALDGRRVLGRGAPGAVMLGALAPDIDAILMPAGWDIYLRFHEIGTHSLPGSLACAGLTALVVHPFARESRRARLAAAACLGSVSHVALDVLSGAQIRLAWPVSDWRASVPLVAMADPYIIGICALAACALLVARRRRRFAASVALAGLLLFFAAKAALMVGALRTLPDRAGRASDRIVEARWASLTEWHVSERTPDALRQWRVRVGAGPTLLLAWPIGPEPPLVTASRALPTVRNFLRAHDLGFAVQIGERDGQTRVLWSDVRFCWRAGRDPGSNAPVVAVTAPDGITRMACALWFGGILDRNGRPLTQVVKVGDWLQTRAP
jgi:membrane-bound metal-dependent hydrolase YbcI (DUF457 family)